MLLPERVANYRCLNTTPPELCAVVAPGINLLTPAHLDTTLKQSESKTKVEKDENPQIQPQQIVSLGSPLPQALAPTQSYFVLNSAFYDSPLTRYAYTTSNQFVPGFFQNPSIETIEPTIKPKHREAEPTTKKPKTVTKSKPPKLQVKSVTTTNNNNNGKADFLNDKPLLEAVKKINPQFIVEDIMPVPGRHVYSSIGMELVGYSKQKPINKKPKTKLKTKKSQVKVEAISRTATTGNVPQIPFGTYFLPYFSQLQQQYEKQLQQQQQQQQGQRKSKQLQKPALKTASLILEPHSKAIVGNGGTAISAPISRAVLKRGVPTNVYFNPESVAIAGVGGKAHAQADLELDLIN
ncbi:uncharacterized protein LOC133326588 [Musca vetustissima]|uniref:uncharacterized protein LOC133326588 n=1 Tax=Musca vetustissima TaxID=27455 RepID=UPI002AB77B9D|nr:uncharacterized protein LOC133326588 [Musca vetustissima]